MAFLGDIAKEIAGDFKGLRNQLSDELSGDADELLLRRFRKQYDTLPNEAIIAIRDSLGHERGETTPCDVCNVIADEEFKMANEEFHA